MWRCVMGWAREDGRGLEEFGTPLERAAYGKGLCGVAVCCVHLRWERGPRTQPVITRKPTCVASRAWRLLQLGRRASCAGAHGDSSDALLTLTQAVG
eukprot:6203082-Pleurochrysis_carterae.AAC.2